MPSRAITRIGRAKGRAKRRALRLPVVATLAERSYQAQLRSYAPRLPALPDVYAAAGLERLRTEIAVAADLTTVIPDHVRRGAEQLCELLRARPASGPCDDITMDELVADLAVWQWGVAEENLRLSEWYIGRPVRYLGVNVKRERCDGTARDARRWHIDLEDRRFLKLIVYLSDVDEGSGPFEYVDASASRRAAQQLGYLSGYLPDGRLEAVTAAHERHSVEGPAGTAAIADACNVFHRGCAPTRRDRYSMTYSYASSRPLQILPEYLPNRAQARHLTASLTARQAAAAHLGGGIATFGGPWARPR